MLAEYNGGSGTSILTFDYYASGVTDNDGITVMANAIQVNLATIEDADNNDAELTHGEKHFPNVTVVAPFGFEYGNSSLV